MLHGGFEKHIKTEHNISGEPFSTIALTENSLPAVFHHSTTN
jgi:hypothetical protein